MERLEPATASDHEAIVALLRACDLPSSDLVPHLQHFLVARDGAALVGVIGLEVHGRDGLLRSLAVPEARRGHGIARRLYAAIIGTARRLGLEHLYVLTTTARGFFELLGFQVLRREEVPEPIRRTEQFRTLCPTSATCMVRVVLRG